MPHRTGIEWTDYSSNPLRAEGPSGKGWSCVKISPGCLHCYSSVLDGRFGTKLGYNAGSQKKVTHIIDEKELRHILSFRPKGPYRGGTTKPKVFPFDMTDLFGDWVPDGTIDRMLAAFALRPDVIFQVLTKRPERMAEYMNRNHGLLELGFADRHYKFSTSAPARVLQSAVDLHPPFRPATFMWPLPNVWIGASVEDQDRADDRIQWLLNTPAAVRFLSCEPLLGPVDIAGWMGDYGELQGGPHVGRQTIDWVIVGGESGPRCRPCNVDWIRSIVSQCQSAGVPVFVKQLGGFPTDINEDLRYMQKHPNVYRIQSVKDKKGGDPSEWPLGLEVRQFPEVSHA